MEQYYGWAIDTQSKDGHGLIGRFWWFGAYEIPKHMLGHLTALFETRKEARKALSRTRRSFPRSRVIKVKVTIVEVMNETWTEV